MRDNSGMGRVTYLLFSIPLLASAQISLTAKPEYIFWSLDPPSTVVFTSEIRSTPKPQSVTLYSMGKPLAQMRDDGIAPDLKANDGRYTCNLQVPTDKQGFFTFEARPNSPAPDAASITFHVYETNPWNASRDAFAHVFEDNYVIVYHSEAEDVLRVRVLQSKRPNGPWKVLEDHTAQASSSAYRGEYSDSGPNVTKRDYYYKIEQYNSKGKLVHTFDTLLIPTYGEGRPLLLTGTPLRSKLIGRAHQ